MTQTNSTSNSLVEYESVDEQWKIRWELDRLCKKVPLSERIFYQYCPEICTIPIGIAYFLSWRAGFRAYGLYKYGKGRLLTITSSMLFPANGYAVHAWANSVTVDPYRKESALYHGTKHAFYNIPVVVGSIFAPITLTFLFASKMSIIPVPDGMHKPGVREVVLKLLYSRVKKYLIPIAITAVASTAFSFGIGMASYNQSCSLLGKMGRKTLGQKEDSTKM